MADTTRLQELERRLALAADQQLDDLRAQIAAAGQEQVRAAVEAYRAKLVELLGGADAARARLTQVTAGPIQEMGLGFLADAAQPFVEQALEARRELEAALRVGPVTLDLGAVAASVPRRDGEFPALAGNSPSPIPAAGDGIAAIPPESPRRDARARCRLAALVFVPQHEAHDAVDGVDVVARGDDVLPRFAALDVALEDVVEHVVRR